ncbi:Probable glycine dehydrogenase (decarboxylating) subunit 1 [Chlamydiales bacterium SCGC AG-110-P3]|nr:Probable glycine dehydrogenase (decarboxylating) subunit 1 [Chlamydiales bacterium SCGC AG-110-P3]
MDFISNKKKQVKAMLETIGIEQIDDLFSEIPDSLIVQRPTDDDGMSEYEGMCHIEALAARNSYLNYDSYLGGGAYEHHVPAFVAAIVGKSEFLTAYTPYQAEASQGMLQAIFEFQSAVCGITGLDVANASVYDGAGACAEAVLMALRACRGRRRVLIGETVNPHYRAVIDQYLFHLVKEGTVELVTVPMDEQGGIVPEAVEKVIDDTVAAILLQTPSFLGVIDDAAPCFASVKEAGGLAIVCCNPVAYGSLRSAKELGADIAVGDLQPLGVPISYGGPYVGYMACTERLMRQLPGRLVGETVDSDGRRGFVLTLQAREQHIRREKATSNICSNQNLAALASLITMLWYGPKGMHDLATTNFQRSAYLRDGLRGISGMTLPHADLPVFNEFVLRCNRPIEQVVAAFHERGVVPGVPLEQYYPQYADALLVAVTECKSKEQLDHYIAVAQEVMA